MVLAISLVLLLIEIWLIIAVITGRNDCSKLRHRIAFLFGASLFIFLVGQICGSISEINDRVDLLAMDIKDPTEYLIFVNRYELNARGSEAIFDIIAALGVGASVIFWSTMRRRLGLDQSNTPSTL
jgi:hypothetical protein